ncbi:hypothetical protein FHT77_002954 [Rhizobium sp. BK181]|nr:hypothetical protein [Rhizobium sp. BK181]MBB3317072.1 hypothetical protein [Rhizobium sp. BK181]
MRKESQAALRSNAMREGRGGNQGGNSQGGGGQGDGSRGGNH